MKAFSTLLASTLTVLSLTAFQASVEASPPLTLISQVEVAQTIDTPLAELTYETPTVTTIEAPTVVEPVVVAPVAAPVEDTAPLVSPTTVDPVVEAPITTTVEATAPPAAPTVATTVVEPVVVAPVTPTVAYWEPSTGVRMANTQGDAQEAMALFITNRGIESLQLSAQQELFGTYRGRFVTGYAPADALVIVSVLDPATSYAFSR
jgi:hypothetical protein